MDDPFSFFPVIQVECHHRSPPPGLDMARFWNSLRFRLISLVVLGMVPPIGLIVHSGLEQRQLAPIYAQEKLRALAKEVSRDYGIVLDIIAQMLRRLAEDPTIKGLDPVACSNRVDLFFSKSPFPFYLNFRT